MKANDDFILRVFIRLVLFFEKVFAYSLLELLFIAVFARYLFFQIVKFFIIYRLKL